MIWEPAGGSASLTSLPTVAARVRLPPARPVVRQLSAEALQGRVPRQRRRRHEAPRAGDARRSRLGVDRAVLRPRVDPQPVHLQPRAGHGDARAAYAVRRGLHQHGEPPRRADRLPGHLLVLGDDREQPRAARPQADRGDGHHGARDQRWLHLQVRSGRLRGAEADLHRIESDLRRRRHGHGRQAAGGTCWVDLEVVDPEPLGAEQKAWLTQYIQEFHNALHTTPIGNYAQLDRRPVVRRQPDHQRAEPKRRRVRAQLLLPQGARREAQGRPAVGLQLLAGGRAAAEPSPRRRPRTGSSSRARATSTTGTRSWPPIRRS